MGWFRRNKWYLLLELWFLLPVIVFAVISLFSFSAAIIGLVVSLPVVFVLVRKTNQYMVQRMNDDIKN